MHQRDWARTVRDYVQNGIWERILECFCNCRVDCPGKCVWNSVGNETGGYVGDEIRGWIGNDIRGWVRGGMQNCNWVRAQKDVRDSVENNILDPVLAFIYNRTVACTGNCTRVSVGGNIRACVRNRARK
jgi:hypothetical protein